MADLGELLAALAGADEAFQTVASRWRVWTHHGRMERGMLADAAQRGRGFVGIFHPPDEGDDVIEDEDVRFWMTRDGKRREERQSHGERTLAIRDGDQWWTYSPFSGAQTGEGEPKVFFGMGDELGPLFAPRLLLAALRFEVTGVGERLGRPVIVARATPVDDAGVLGFQLDSLGAGADEHLLEVDRQTGVIVRAESRIGGEPMSIHEAIELAFDTPLDPALFVFSTPDGAQATAFELPPEVRVDISPQDAARQVPFVLHALPASLGRQPMIHVYQLDADTPVAHLYYEDPQITLQLRAAEGDERGDAGPYVRPSAPDWPQAQVMLIRDETHVTLASTTFDADRLVELAGQLERVDP